MEVADIGISEPGVVISGTIEQGRLGEALSGIGDLDDSGTAELALGAPGEGVSMTDEGTVYVTVVIVAEETRDLRLSKGTPTLEWAPTPGAGELPSAEHVFRDYQMGTGYSVHAPVREAALAL